MTKTHKKTHNMLWIGAIACVILPILNSFLLSFVYAYYMDGNIMFQNYNAIVSSLSDFINIICIFAGYALVVRSIFMYTLAKSGIYLLFNIVLYFIQQASAVAITAMTTVCTSDQILAYAMYGVMNLLLNSAVLAIVMLIVIFMRSFAVKRELPLYPSSQIFDLRFPLNRCVFFVALFFFVRSLTSGVINTVSLISEFGGPQNSAELMTLLTPYVEAVIYSVIGYAVLAVICLFSQKQPEDLGEANAVAEE